MYLFYINLFIYTLFLSILQLLNNRKLYLKNNRSLSERDYNINKDKQVKERPPYSDSDVLESDGELEQNIKTYLHSEDEGHLTNVNTNFNGTKNSIRGVNTANDKNKVLSKVLSDIKNCDDCNYEEIKKYIKENVDEKHVEKLTSLVDELQNSKKEQKNVKIILASQMNNIRKKMRKNIVLFLILTPVIALLSSVHLFTVTVPEIIKAYTSTVLARIYVIFDPCQRTYVVSVL
ncbi:Plasmodium exported protein, unknown function [Plasmodium malariae]|uniref:Uncharacterized protein n=1 Tax=Plasmodium malariae TaxID=5858 RepID=A0A1D3JKP6_PLAMA|nr:Plasmodium exported protein, unknown function [Plasmodium malariae]SBT87013.1 Plasmodium exported protein, unknown function [Plasmodium malariae]